MNDAARKMLYGAAALALTVMIIYIAFNIFDRANHTADNIEENQAYTEQVTREYGVVKYDGLSISGSTAITYIKQLIGVHEVPVELLTSNMGGSARAVSASDYSAFRDINSTYYINPMAMYDVSVERDTNDVIVKVLIKQQ